MRLTCEKSMLVQGLNIAGRTVAQKSSLSVIEGILCQAGANDGSAIQAKHRIHRRVVFEILHQIPGHIPGFTEPGFLEGHINIIIDVAVVGGEMASGNPQGDIAMADGQLCKTDHSKFLLCENKESVFHSSGTSVSSGAAEKRFFSL